MAAITLKGVIRVDIALGIGIGMNKDLETEKMRRDTIDRAKEGGIGGTIDGMIEGTTGEMREMIEVTFIIARAQGHEMVILELMKAATYIRGVDGTAQKGTDKKDDLIFQGEEGTEAKVEPVEIEIPNRSN